MCVLLLWAGCCTTGSERAEWRCHLIGCQVMDSCFQVYQALGCVSTPLCAYSTVSWGTGYLMGLENRVMIFLLALGFQQRGLWYCRHLYEYGGIMTESHKWRHTSSQGKMQSSSRLFQDGTKPQQLRSQQVEGAQCGLLLLARQPPKHQANVQTVSSDRAAEVSHTVFCSSSSGNHYRSPDNFFF